MTAIEPRPAQPLTLTQPGDFTREQIELLKNTVAAGTTDLELALFLEVCKSSGLNPFQRQVYAIKRRVGREEKMTIQTGIDGYRLIAARSGVHLGTTDPEFGPVSAEGFPEYARVVVRKLVHGHIAEFPATARWSEYVQEKDEWANNQKTGKKTVTEMWKRMSHTMLGKCFDDQTEVLTTHGFQRFSAITGQVLQVTENGMQATSAKPFAQPYNGEMVTLNSDDLNFCVTPNHDMVTTAGKIEAGLMFEQARTRPQHYIPRKVQDNRPDAQLSDRAIQLAAAYLADGTDTTTGFNIEVSRVRKVEALRSLAMHDRERKRDVAGAVAVMTSGREVVTRTDKQVFVYAREAVQELIGPHKIINLKKILGLSQRQLQLFVDAWLSFDGHRQKKTGVRRIYMSRRDHAEAFEVLAVAAGYAVSPRRERVSDGTDKPNYYMTVSERDAIPVVRWGEGSARTGLELTPNTSGVVWCVTVPSGVIVVRRNGFSMLCGNCAEALALRKAFPAELSGVYSDVEMQQADTVPVEKVSSDTTGKTQDPAHEAKMQKWAEKIGDMAARVCKLAGGEAVQDLLELWEWRTDAAAARGAYDALKDLGRLHAPPAAQEGQDAPANVQAEELATPEQIKSLQAIARSAGASTSDERAVLWGYFLNAPAVHTKTLTSEQAALLLSSFADLDDADRKVAMAEARKEAKGQLL